MLNDALNAVRTGSSSQ